MFCHIVALPTQNVTGEQKFAKQHMFGVGPISHIVLLPFLTIKQAVCTSTKTLLEQTGVNKAHFS